MAKPNDARTAAARSLVLSGSLHRRLGQLERAMPLDPEIEWARDGEHPGITIAPQRVHQLVAAARRLAEAKRYRAAVQAYEAAEGIVQQLGQAVRRARLRALAETELARRGTLPRQGTEARRRAAGNRARRYVAAARKLARRRPELTLTSIAAHLHQTTNNPPSVRQIIRYLRDASLK